MFVVERIIQWKSVPTSDSDGVKNSNGENKKAFVGDAPAKPFNESGESSCRVLSWQMGISPVVYENTATCNMFRSSPEMINYREANATIRPASCKRYSFKDYYFKGYRDLPLTFRPSGAKVLFKEKSECT